MVHWLKNKTFRIICMHTVIAVTAVVIWACGDKNANTAPEAEKVYHHFLALPHEKWSAKDTLWFGPIVLTKAHYRLTVEVRHTNHYPYRNLDITLHRHTTPGTDSLSSATSTYQETDTLRQMLANEEGLWTGQGWGGLYLASFTPLEMQATNTDTCRIALTHAMGQETIRGVSDVGIKLQRTDEQ